MKHTCTTSELSEQIGDTSVTETNPTKTTTKLQLLTLVLIVLLDAWVNITSISKTETRQFID